jgi:hypothetical protein
MAIRSDHKYLAILRSWTIHALPEAKRPPTLQNLIWSAETTLIGAPGNMTVVDLPDS